RVDVGIGRAPGSDMATARALSHGPGALPLEAYPQQVIDLLHYLKDSMPEGHPFHGIHASPAGSGVPEVWCLGSSTDSAYTAGRLGLPFSFAQFIAPETGEQAVKVYRDHFEPSQWCAEPRISIGVSTICAPTEEEALDLSLSRYCWRFRHGQVPSVETAKAFEYSAPELEYIRYHRSQSAVGDPQQVRARLEAIAEQLTAEEVILLTITHDFAARVRSYRLVAEAFGLAGVEAAPATAR
ncbi:MAG: MsnO8 family LLM class oxidoreductase, partial [Chloroflexota bacterium]